MSAARPLIVVKLGGSLLSSPGLDPLLRLLAGARRARIVIVPGGGLFADAVRQTQQRLGFDDVLAHRLALDAMSHVSEIVASRDAAFAMITTPQAVADIHRQGRVPVWHPAALRAGHPDIPEGWAITSDSLSAWLAAELGADRLVLCKSVDAAHASGERTAFEGLADAGIVDDAFPAFAARYGGEVRIVGPALHGDLDGLLGLAVSASHAA